MVSIENIYKTENKKGFICDLCVLWSGKRFSLNQIEVVFGAVKRFLDTLQFKLQINFCPHLTNLLIFVSTIKEPTMLRRIIKPTNTIGELQNGILGALTK